MKSGQIILPKSSRWGVFILSFVVMFIFTGIISGLFSSIGLSERIRVLSVSVIQGLLAFVFPTLLTWILTSSEPAVSIGLREQVSGRLWLWIISLYIIAYPALCQTVFWNEHMSLPDSMGGLEATWRKWEEAGAKTTHEILSVSSIGAMIVNVLIVGLFTGFAEEMFFRAGFQKLMIQSGMHPGIAIWIAALIFSAVHMQFFGFVPRLLLGAMFGYVYYRTGSIWASALLHGINNSIVVVTTWLAALGIISENVDDVFIIASGFPWIFVASSTITIIFLIYTAKPVSFFFKRNS